MEAQANPPLFITQGARVSGFKSETLGTITSPSVTTGSSTISSPKPLLHQSGGGGNLSSATQLLQKTHENDTVDKQLDEKRKLFYEKMKQLQEAEETIKARKAEFKEQVDKFERFMNDNEEKRLRAVRRAQEEIKAREALEADIDQKNSQLESLKNQKEHILNNLASLAIYREYLESVAEVSDDFQGIPDILARYSTLLDANQHLLKAQDLHTAQMDSLRSSLSQFTKEKQNEVLVLQSTVADSKSKLESRRSAAAQCDALEGQGYHGLVKRYKALAEIGMAIDNIYSRLPSRHSSQRETPTEKLETVKVILSDLQEIVNGINVNTSSTTNKQKQ